ncbi:DUF2177 family protein [Patescibacteria group bacterium]|nr:DUF2177 family protein [Patescibacteria group bacterium]MBU1500883.1 DUF2177 family protein [Patescibacteria group bacterium]MBU2080938.1 DUF2177 family protein [Patescibacteria group bacterium]MBU2124043.1 DUF2177 family protein [Patescibacteria group bacterium]MBU2194666.1 DUF2177 family protein [Patescibacteria group bacterium]
MQILILAAIAFPVMLVIDLLWIGVVASKFYNSQLGSMLRPDVLWVAALLFYVIYAVAIAYFVISPALATHSVSKLVISALLLGLAAYAAYDLSNLATLAGWPITVTIVDLIWGMVFTTVTSLAVYFTAVKFLNY